MRDRDIIVRGLETGHSVTYRRVPEKPLLVALDPIRDDPDAETAKFLVDAAAPMVVCSDDPGSILADPKRDHLAPASSLAKSWHR